MPDENQQPNPQPSQPENPAPSPEVIQPANSNVVSPPSSSPEPQPVVSSPITQPTAMVNGQPFQPTTPMSSSQFEQTSVQKSWTWLYIFIALSVLFPIGALVFLVYMMLKKQWDRFFIGLGILQVVGAALFFLAMISLGGVTGGEFVALLLFATLVPAVGLVALANLIGLPIYMRKHKLQGKGLVFGILSLVISLVLALYGAYSVYQLRVAAPKHLNQLSTRNEKAASLSNSALAEKIQNCEIESLIIKSKGGDYPGVLNIKNQDTNMFVSKADLAGAEQAIKDSNQKCGNVRILHENDSDDGSIISAISLDEAKSLLTSCKIEQVRMPMDKKYLSKTELEALDETGIYLMEGFDNKPFGIGFNESTRSKITPVARQAASQCKGMSFMLSPGHWSQSI